MTIPEEDFNFPETLCSTTGEFGGTVTTNYFNDLLVARVPAPSNWTSLRFYLRRGADSNPGEMYIAWQIEDVNFQPIFANHSQQRSTLGAGVRLPNAGDTMVGVPTYTPAQIAACRYVSLWTFPTGTGEQDPGTNYTYEAWGGFNFYGCPPFTEPFEVGCGSTGEFGDTVIAGFRDVRLAARVPAPHDWTDLTFYLRRGSDPTPGEMYIGWQIEDENFQAIFATYNQQRSTLLSGTRYPTTGETNVGVPDYTPAQTAACRWVSLWTFPTGTGGQDVATNYTYDAWGGFTFSGCPGKLVGLAMIVG